MKSFRWHLILLLAMLLLNGGLAAGQTTSSITGLVKDSTGAVIPGVTVKAREVRTGLERAALTDDTGLYRIMNLPRGVYEVKAELTGFKTAVLTGIELTVDETKRLDITLEVGEISEVITVEAEPPVINTEEGRLSSVITNRQIVDLPLSTRNFIQLALTQPGVVAGGVGSNTGGISIGGARSRGTSFVLDGVDNNDPVVAGFTQVTVPLDSVQEFRLIRNSMSAEYGRLSGGALSIATKSGTNEIHGTVWEFHRNRAISARNFFVRGEPGQKRGSEKPKFIRNQFGFELGGPVIKNKTFAYGSFEVTTERSSDFEEGVFFTPQAVRAATGRVARELIQKFPGPANLGPPFTFATVGGERVPITGTAIANIPQVEDNYNFVVKLDHEWMEGKNRISGRYAYNKPVVGAGTLISNTLVRGFQLDFTGLSQNLGLSDIHIFSTNLINEFRFGVTRDGFAWRPQNPEVPTITITGMEGFGAATNMPQNRFPMVYQLMDTVSWKRGAHAFKFGAEFRHIQRARTFDALVRGSYAFASAADFLADRARTYSLSFDLTRGIRADGFRVYDRNEWMFFFQDDWKVTRNFTFNYGIRYENFRPPKEETGRISQILIRPGQNIFQDVISNIQMVKTEKLWNADNNNFAPRIGFAWDPTGRAKTSIRGGYGLFYERLFQNIDENIQFNPPFMTTLTFDVRRGQTFVYSIPSWVPSELKGGPIPVGAQVRGHDPKMRTSYMQSWFFGLQHELVGGLVVEADYQASIGRKLPVTINYNRFDGDLLDGRLDRINREFGPVLLVTNMINSSYNSLQLSVRRPMSGGLSFQASYTLSKFIDEDSDNFAHDEPVTIFDIKKNQRGLSRFHIPHRLVINWVWDMPFFSGRGGLLGALLGGWTINGIVAVQSGRPLSVFTSNDERRGGDMNRDGQLNDRPNLVGNPVKSGSNWGDGRLDRSAFSTSFIGLGNVGRNTVTGPDLANVDFAVYKNFKVTALGEAGRVQFRAEVFNLFNRTNFNPNFTNTNLASGLFGKATRAFDPRLFQFALKLYF